MIIIYHIVKYNEFYTDILRNYNISIEELEEYNQHINNIKNLKIGMKLFIPLVNEEIDTVIESSQKLIEDYQENISQTPKEVKNNLNASENQFTKESKKIEEPDTINKREIKKFNSHKSIPYFINQQGYVVVLDKKNKLLRKLV